MKISEIAEVTYQAHANYRGQNEMVPEKPNTWCLRPRCTRHNIKPQQRVSIPRTISCHWFRHSALHLAREWDQVAVHELFPCICRILGEHQAVLENGRSWSRYIMANAAILALSAIKTPILIVDPAGFALRVCGWLRAWWSYPESSHHLGSASARSLTRQARREWQFGGSFTPVPMDKCS